jgi:AcrR family transcriptional regulator
MRKFSDEQRERIREELIETGRELLLTYGPDKTTVKDITDPAGIAKPTFYQFFDAKADLYLEIFDREFDQFVENLHVELRDVDDPQTQLERLFHCYVEFAEENKLVQQVFLEGNNRDIVANASTEEMKSVEEKQMEALVPVIEEIGSQSGGPISEMDPITVLGIMGTALGFMVLHKDEIANSDGETTHREGMYHHIRETLISILSRGLTVQ